MQAQDPRSDRAVHAGADQGVLRGQGGGVQRQVHRPFLHDTVSWFGPRSLSRAAFRPVSCAVHSTTTYCVFCLQHYLYLYVCFVCLTLCFFVCFHFFLVDSLFLCVF